MQKKFIIEYKAYFNPIQENNFVRRQHFSELLLQVTRQNT